MELPFVLQKKITDFLVSLPNIHDSESQRAFLYQTVLDRQLQDQICLGKPLAQFIPLLVSVLVDYGKLEDGRYAIEAVLKAAKESVGLDKREYCDTLLEELQNKIFWKDVYYTEGIQSPKRL